MKNNTNKKKIKLDKTDLKILHELDLDARQSNKKLAKKLKISRDVTTYRIKQLEKKKIIEGYYTLIDFSKLRYLLPRLYLKLQNTTNEIEKEIIEYLKKENTLTVYEIEGNWDLAIGFLVKSFEEFDKILNKFQAKYKKYINKKNISLMLEYSHHPRKYLTTNPNKNYTPLITGSSKKENLDKADLTILKIISANAKISLINISKELKLTPVAIRYRIKQLEKKKVILAYKALIDYNKLGYQYYKIDLDLEDTSIIKTLQQFCIEHPNIIYEDRTFGGSDFEFDIEVKNHKEMKKIIQQIKTKFPKIIRTIQYYKAERIHKYSYYPN